MSEKSFREKLIAACNLKDGASDEQIVESVQRMGDFQAWEKKVSDKINESGGSLTRAGAIEVLKQHSKNTKAA